MPALRRPRAAQALTWLPSCPSHARHCGSEFFGPGAEALAFNSDGACPTCSGTGIARTRESRRARARREQNHRRGRRGAHGARLMWDLMKQVCGAMGVRTERAVFASSQPAERDIVFNGPAEKKPHPLQGEEEARTSPNSTSPTTTPCAPWRTRWPRRRTRRACARVAPYPDGRPLPRLRWHAPVRRPRGSPIVRGHQPGDKQREMTLERSGGMGRRRARKRFPKKCAPWRNRICESFEQHGATACLSSGLGYLSLDRAGATLSTGERQRVQLARARAQSHDRRALRDGRAFHRPAPRQHRRAFRRYARPHRPTATRW